MEDSPAQAWWELDSWPPSVADCEGCEGLLWLLTRGWGLPPKRWSVPQEEKAAAVRRARYLGTKSRAGRPILVEGEDGDQRRLRFFEGADAWQDAGVPSHVLEEYFPEAGGRGRPRLHPQISPETVGRVTKRIGRALEHLEEINTGRLAEHFTDIYGRPWPPHLPEIHEVLIQKWRRGGDELSPGRREYERQGTSLRVAAVLPLSGWATIPEERGSVESVTYRPCPLSYDQLRPILDRA